MYQGCVSDHEGCKKVFWKHLWYESEHGTAVGLQLIMHVV